MENLQIKTAKVVSLAEYRKKRLDAMQEKLDKDKEQEETYKALLVENLAMSIMEMLIDEGFTFDPKNMNQFPLYLMLCESIRAIIMSADEDKKVRKQHIWNTVAKTIFDDLTPYRKRKMNKELFEILEQLGNE